MLPKYTTSPPPLRSASCVYDSFIPHISTPMDKKWALCFRHFGHMIV